MIISLLEPKNGKQVIHIDFETNMFAVCHPDTWKNHTVVWYSIGNGMDADRFQEEFPNWLDITNELN